MDYFETEENKQKEALEEKKYQELYAKQAKISKIIMLAVFIPMGFIFLIVGVSLALSLEGEDFIVGIVFSILGAIFFLLGILLYFVIPKKGNYKRYKKSIERYGGLNTTSMFIQIGMLEERVKVLEEEIEDLRRKMR